MRALFVFALAAAGCAPAMHDAELADLRHRLDEAQRRETVSENKIQELEDRVFLLTDQLESQKVAATRTAAPAPRLPVVTLRPTAADDAPADDGAGVEYQGDARTATPDRVRPLVRLDESRPSYVKHAAPAPPPVAPADGRENLGVAPAPPVARAIEKGERERPVADPLKLYRAAYDDLRAGRHDEAVRGFRDFVRLYPRHDYADNAQYWLGECFYDRKQYAEAAAEFHKVVARWPLGNKAPDALLKLGFSLLASGDTQKGREALRELPGTYPRTEAARLAEERLAQLKEEPK
jgi:tol-pal system protein YbgF